MKILVLGTDESWNEISATNKEIDWVRVNDINAFYEKNDADAFFNLSEDAALPDYCNINKPVLVNSVTKTIKEIKGGANITRINGWNGFLKRNLWEVAGEITEAHTQLFKMLQKKIIEVPDEPGFISAKVIAMIINEAFFAKSEAISTEDEIDIAMKLGTNYPYGPFEWSKLIGVKNIYELLFTLGKTDVRYIPSSLLAEKANAQ